jgi:predicted ferric reductase
MTANIERWRGPLTVVVLCALPVALWAWASKIPLTARFGDAATTLASAGIALGLVGATSFAANLLLGARLPYIQTYFGGVQRMYAVHRINGRVAWLLLLAHALVVVAGRATVSASTALSLFVPSRSGWAVPIGAAALVAMAAGVGATLYLRLGHEVFIYVQRTFGVIFAAAGVHVWLIVARRGESPALTWFLGVLWLAALAAWVYRSLFGNVLVRRHRYRVVAAVPLDESVVEITMAPVDEGLRFVAGQFAYVTFYSSAFNAQFHPFSVTSRGGSEIITLRPGDARNQYHPFSITSSPKARDLKVCVKAVGDFTRRLHRLDEGAVAVLEGPYGEFSYRTSVRPAQVWVAGGIGITPFLSMARSLEPSEREVELYYGVKSRATAYFADELAALAARGVLELHVVPEDEEGFVQIDRIERDVGALAHRDFYLCGPPAMVASMSAQLEARGVPARQIHYERFGFGPH